MEKETKIVVIGGVAGGASAAARARRLSEQSEITIIERGANVSFANCGLPYHIAGVIKERNSLLVQTPETLHANLRIGVRTNTEAIKIDREHKQVVVTNLLNGEVESITYDKLVFSPGAEPVRLPIPGSENPRVKVLRSLADMDEIEKILASDCSGALIIGGGYVGLEMAEAFRLRELEVSMVELSSQVMGPIDPEMATLLHDELRRQGVKLYLNSSVEEFRDNGAQIEVRLSNGNIVNCGVVIVAVGVRPEVKLAREAGLEIGKRGGVVVDEYMQTSDLDIFAVGDAVEVKDFVGEFPTLVPLAGPANRQGRIAADNIFGKNSKYKGTQGTAICKLFDLAVAMTGLNEKVLKRENKAYKKVYLHPAHHATYFPGALQMTLKLLFDPTNGKLFGAQAIGVAGVDKYIDVIATAIRAGLSVYDLEDLELCYAPPFGSAKAPVNYTGFVAANILRGDTEVWYAEDIGSFSGDPFLLDVRTPAEFAKGTISGAVNISLQQLRDRIKEIPRDKEILVFCQVGLRGYLAMRVLKQNGFRCRNLSGGMRAYWLVFPQVV